MAYLIAGGLVLAVLLFVANGLTKANPAKLVQTFKTLAGLVLVLVCIFLAATGRWVAAIPLAGFAASLLGFGGKSLLGRLGGFSLGGGRQRSAGTASRVRSKFIAMELDHDSGSMDGEVLSGQFAGSALSALSQQMLHSLWREVQHDADSLALLEAYLDSRFANWRVHFEANTATGHRNTASSSALTDQEAYEILGLAPGASLEEIRAAHRRLIKRVHPDSGGSAFLAARLNEAKDRLLNNRH